MIEPPSNFVDRTRFGKLEAKAAGRFVLFSALTILTSCMNSPQPRAPADVLAGPYEVKLVAAKTTAAPGEIAMFTIQYHNTGKAILWVPTRDQITFEVLMKTDPAAGGTVELPPSACSGLRFLAVRPGRTLALERGLKLPVAFGAVQVTLQGHPETATMIEIKPPGSF